MEHLCRLFKQKILIKDIKLPEKLPLEQQDELITSLSQIDNKYYIQCVLKKLIAILEQSGTEILSLVYETYCSFEIISAKPLNPTALEDVIYNVNGYDLTIKESPNVIGFGTTGRRTWEAALFLSTYLPKLKIHGVILELGSGTGLTGIAASQLQDVYKVYFTDGDCNLLQFTEENVNLNTRNNCSYEFHQLLWGENDDLPLCDYVVGADVTYDKSSFPDLVSTIANFLNHGTKTVFIAGTIRDANTLKCFESTLDQQSLKWELVVTFHPDNNRHDEYNKIWYRTSTPINLYIITK